MRGLFLLFLVVPISELWLLFVVGDAIGAWPTLGLVILTAFIGVNVLRHQGISTLNRAQRRLEAGELPGQELLEGFMLAIAGALLLTPGFITDTIGFTLLLPWPRGVLARHLIKSGKVQGWQGMQGRASFSMFRAGQWGPGTGPGQAKVYEGEVEQPRDSQNQLHRPPKD
jgi:UPF0716 protein FxsA